MPYSNMALDADRKNGPAARSFAADAHDCIMVRCEPTEYRSYAGGTPNFGKPTSPTTELRSNQCMTVPNLPAPRPAAAAT